MIRFDDNLKIDKAVVLSSGGVDSTTCLAMAVEKYGAENVATVSCFYGQRHEKELACASKIAEHYKALHYELDLSCIFERGNCSLLKTSDQTVMLGSYGEQIKVSAGGPVSTYVPFRNGSLVAAVTSFAMSVFPEGNLGIFLGAHSDDAAGNAYADCSVAFVEKMSAAILEGTYNRVQLVAPFAGVHKSDIVAEGLKRNVPYELTWSCYQGGDTPCHRCGTCIDREEAFKKNGAVDPLAREA